MTPPISRLGRLAPTRCPPRFLLALAAVAAAWCPAQAALAAPPSGLVVVPRPKAQPGLSYFNLQGRPGSAQQAGVIELRNPTAKRLRVVLSPVDGETLGTLGSAYAPPGSRPHGSTLWLRLGRRAVALSPRASVQIPLSIELPHAVQAGDYLSGVSVEALDQRARNVARKGVSIASVARYAIGVEIAVPGTRHPLIQFTGAQIRREPAGLAFLLMARNSGNTILKGVQGFVRITRGGHEVLSRPIEAGTFVTHTAIAYPVPAFQQAPAQGTRYRVTAWLRYAGGTAKLDTAVTFGHRQAVIQQQYAHSPPAAAGTPWWKIAGAAGVVLYALLTTTLLLRRRSRALRQAPPAVEQ
jgi:hypothetical protein